MSASAQITPALLIWARETAGLDIKDVVEEFDRKRVTAEVLHSWEKGKSQPTYAQLERLAYKIYKRPVALFFFPAPPEERTSQESFRTLTAEITNTLSPKIRFLLRRAQALQLGIAELAGASNPSERFLPQEVNFSIDTPVEEMASSVREYLGISLSEQLKWGSINIALKQWRERIESNGIFVFKDSFQEEDISGFCLHDEIFPVIYINNNKPKSRQIFTLFHELAHILFETGGIDFRRDDYIEELAGKNKTIEITCNKFAGEFLVPKDDFMERTKSIGKDSIEQKIPDLAEYYSVSREVILRRFSDLGRVNQDFYHKKVEEWGRESSERTGGGGNWYATKNTYLSDAFLKLAFQKYSHRQITADQLSDYIGVKTKNLQEFESAFLRGMGGPA